MLLHTKLPETLSNVVGQGESPSQLGRQKPPAHVYPGAQDLARLAVHVAPYPPHVFGAVHLQSLLSLLPLQKTPSLQLLVPEPLLPTHTPPGSVGAAQPKVFVTVS